MKRIGAVAIETLAGVVRAAVRFRWVVLALWILVTVAAVLGLPSLASVVHNDDAAFLPASSPSVRAEKLADPFVQTGSQTGVLAVVRANGPLTGPDLRALARVEGMARRSPHVVAVTSGSLSTNRQAITALVRFSAVTDGGGSAGARAVAALRSELSRALPPGLQGYVTGSLPVLVDQQAAEVRTATWVSLLSALVILLLLAVAFRSALAPLVALAPAGLALTLAGPLIAESTKVGVQISSLLQLLLTALVLGAGTDYGLFMVFRYRELLGQGVPPRQAVVDAATRVGGTVVFSALTVVAALCSLLLASFGLYRGVGPGLAIGIVVVLVVDLTLLPALLAILGPLVFWPDRARPRWVRPGAWGVVAARICRRPIGALVAGTLAFACLALFVLAYAPSGFNPGGTIPGSDSAAGEAVLSQYFGVTQTNPSGIVFAYRDSVWSHPRTLAVDEAGLQHGIGLDDVVGALNPNGTVLDHQELQGLYRRLGPPQHLPVVEPVGLGLPVWEYDAYRASAQFISADGRRVLFEAALTAGSAGSTAAMQAIPGVRTGVARVARLTGASASGVLGQAAAAADVSAVSGEDVVRVVPVVLVVLALLLTIGVGSLVAPLYLVATVALSFLAALGLSVAIFQLIGGEIGVNFTLPFFLFIFVMALGEDYNILVMRRIREESVAWSPATAVTRAVAATGGTVTAAGLVLASTFGVLAFTTSGQIREIGTGLALGILLDTFVVRTLLVPSAVARLGRVTWWPTRLWHEQPMVDPVIADRPAVIDLVTASPGRQLLPWGLCGIVLAGAVLAGVVAVVQPTPAPAVSISGGGPPLQLVSGVTLPSAVLRVTAMACAPGGWCLGYGSGISSQQVLVRRSGGRWVTEAAPWEQSSSGGSRSPGDDLACPARQRCLIPAGRSIWWTADAGRHWLSVDPGGGVRVTAISCPSALRCVGVGTVTSGGATRPAAVMSTNGGRTWQPTAAPAVGTPQGLACPTVRICLAVGSTRSGTSTVATVATSTDGGLSWSAGGALPPTRITGAIGDLACTQGTAGPTCRLAVTAPTGQAAMVVASDDAGTSWVQQELPNPSSRLLYTDHGFGCAARSCLALTVDGLLGSDDGSATWSDLPLPTGMTRPTDLFCGTTTCVLAGLGRLDAQLLATSSDGGLTWTVDQPLNGYLNVSSVSCAAAGRCLAGVQGTGGESGVLTGAGRHWQLTRLSSRVGRTLVSCAPGGECVAVSTNGLGGSTLDVRTAAGKWRSSPVPFAVISIVCPTVRHCVAAGVKYDASRGYRPIVVVGAEDDGRHWTVTRLSGPSFITVGPVAVCFTALNCLVTEATGRGGFAAWYSSDSGERWSKGARFSGTYAPESLACTPLGTCWATSTATSVAIGPGNPGRRLVESTDGGRTWRTVALPSAYDVANPIGTWCTSTGTCWLLFDTSGIVNELGTTDGGVTWYTSRAGRLEGSVAAVDCTAPTACTAATSSSTGLRLVTLR